MVDSAAAQTDRTSTADTSALLVGIEARLIGWALRGDFGALEYIADIRDEAANYNAPHDRILAAIFAAQDRGLEVSPAAIALQMASDAGLIELGGREYLVGLVMAAPAFGSCADAQKQIDRSIATYRATAGRTALLHRAEYAAEALRLGEPDAMDRLADLSRDAAELNAARNIAAKPFAYRPPEQIPTRKWLYGRHAIRGFISATAAPGGVGKTALAIAESLALVTGRNLLNDAALTRCAVWYLGLEDPLDEYERRVGAAMLLHKIAPSQVAGGLFLNSGRGQEFIIASEGRDGLDIHRPVVSAIVRNIRQNNIGLLIVDPFCASHLISEQDNTKIAAIARQWADIADQTGCAVELVHHVRKGSVGQEASADDARGASAFVNATRSARFLVPMAREEAEQANIEADNRRRFFRVVNGKANLTLHNDAGAWRELVSMNLRNGDGGTDDHVGAVQGWAMPDGAALLSPEATAAFLASLREKPARADVRSREAWAGMTLGAVAGWDMNDKGTETRAKRVLAAMLRAGTIRTETRKDEHRHTRSFIVPGEVQA